MSTMTEETAKALRSPFPDEIVGKLPRVTCKDCRNAPSRCCQAHEKRECSECRNYMTTRHIHLDYVGHAAVTDRLLQVDPSWTWEPVAWSPDGLPLIRDGQLWIRLTVCDVQRLGVGSADGKSGTDAIKEMIGDALRNAAMRFGVAIDLWSKEDLHAKAPEPVAEAEVIADLVERMNALPVDDRKRCKAMFVDSFGKPDDLRASEVSTASDVIAAFEQATEELRSGVAAGTADETAGEDSGEPSPAEDHAAVEATPVSEMPSTMVHYVTDPTTGEQLQIHGGGMIAAKTQARMFAVVAKFFHGPSDLKGTAVDAWRKEQVLQLCTDLGYRGLTSRKQIGEDLARKLIDYMEANKA